jgi:hypothetical protein
MRGEPSSRRRCAAVAPGAVKSPVGEGAAHRHGRLQHLRLATQAIAVRPLRCAGVRLSRALQVHGACISQVVMLAGTRCAQQRSTGGAGVQQTQSAKPNPQRRVRALVPSPWPSDQTYSQRCASARVTSAPRDCQRHRAGAAVLRGCTRCASAALLAHSALRRAPSAGEAAVRTHGAVGPAMRGRGSRGGSLFFKSLDSVGGTDARLRCTHDAASTASVR